MSNQSNSPAAAVPDHAIAKFVLHKPGNAESTSEVKLFTQIPKAIVRAGYYVSRSDETLVVFVEGYVSRQDLVCMKMLTPHHLEHASQTMTSGIFHSLFKASDLYH